MFHNTTHLEFCKIIFPVKQLRILIQHLCFPGRAILNTPRFVRFSGRYMYHYGQCPTKNNPAFFQARQTTQPVYQFAYRFRRIQIRRFVCLTDPMSEQVCQQVVFGLIPTGLFAVLIDNRLLADNSYIPQYSPRNNCISKLYRRTLVILEKSYNLRFIIKKDEFSYLMYNFITFA